MIWVALPVHEERHTVGLLLWRLREVFGEAERDFRILAMDDGSGDGTAEVLEPYRRVMPLEVERHERRRGWATSLEELIRAAVQRSEYPRRDGLLAMQADFTDGPEAIPEMLRRFQGGADLVAGRTTGIAGAPRQVRWVRRAAGILRPPLPEALELDDPFCGFRLYRLMVLARALRDLPEGEPLLRHEGWAAHLELLAAVSPHVRRAEQVDVAVDYSRRYRPSRFRALPALWGIARARRDRRLRGGPAATTGAEAAG